jgi:protein-tyrosine phosphatase
MKNTKRTVFPFNKKKPSGAGLKVLKSDLHSHLIPGIDDGALDLETSIRLIRGLVDLGYEKIITTPHVNADIFPNTPSIINEGRAAVEAELRRQQIGVEFRAAAEYLMDDQFARALDEGQELLTLKDNLILVELSFVVPAINLKDLLFKLQLKGYQPVLAHPERYLYFGASKGWYEQLREAGCLFQLNLLSFTGYYGRASRDLVQYLTKKRFVDFLGTDMHHERHLEVLRSSPIVFRMAKELTDAGLVRNAFL